jgi:sulfur-carrier protein
MGSAPGGRYASGRRDRYVDMARLRFTQNLQRHVECPEAQVEGASVREVLEAYFRERPRARGYVLDEQGALRRHMLVFVNGQVARDRKGLSDPLGPGDTVDVMQALSGG